MLSRSGVSLSSAEQGFSPRGNKKTVFVRERERESQRESERERVRERESQRERERERGNWQNLSDVHCGGLTQQ